jgi:hypothetical protein
MEQDRKNGRFQRLMFCCVGGMIDFSEMIQDCSNFRGPEGGRMLAAASSVPIEFQKPAHTHHTGFLLAQPIRVRNESLCVAGWGCMAVLLPHA